MLKPSKRPSAPAPTPRTSPTAGIWLWGVGSVAIILLPLFWVVLAG